MRVKYVHLRPRVVYRCSHTDAHYRNIGHNVFLSFVMHAVSGRVQEEYTNYTASLSSPHLSPLSSRSSPAGVTKGNNLCSKGDAKLQIGGGGGTASNSGIEKVEGRNAVPRRVESWRLTKNGTSRREWCPKSAKPKAGRVCGPGCGAMSAAGRSSETVCRNVVKRCKVLTVRSMRLGDGAGAM